MPWWSAVSMRDTLVAAVDAPLPLSSQSWSLSGDLCLSNVVRDVRSFDDLYAQRARWLAL